MREPTFIGAAGMPRVGKTRANKEQAKKEITKRNPQKVLIFDSQGEYNTDDKDIREIQLYAKPIHINQVAAFSANRFIECCRIIPYKDNGRPMSLSEKAAALNKVMDYFRNGLLIVEDFKQFAAASMNQELVNRLCTFAHSGTDVLVSLQGVGQFLPIMWQNMKWLRLHKTTDSVTRHADKFPEKIEFLSIAENLLNTRYYDGDYWVTLMIDLERGFIYGKYTQAEFVNASKEYIFQNKGATIGKLLHHIDDSGHKKYNDATALQQVIYRFTHSYSQYSPRLK